MIKLCLAALTATLVATLTLVTLSPSAEAAAPCKAKKIESKLLTEACKAGGQKAAKDAMKKWMKTAKKQDPKVTCQTCHSKLAGDYPKKKDAWDLYKKFGGE